MIIVDAHEDIAWNALALGRDVLAGALETRKRQEEREHSRHVGHCMLGLPEWLAGGVALVFGTLFSAPARAAVGAWDSIVYADAEEAHQRGSDQLDYYWQLAERSDRIDLVTSRADLGRVLASWEGGSPRVGIVPAMEGADHIRRPAEVAEWYGRGVRLVGLTWQAGSRYAGGNKEPGPLTDAGRELLAAMGEVGMILDISHLAEAAFWETVDRYEGIVVASHANPRALVPIERSLSDPMIQALADRDGVVGIVLYNAFLKPGWKVADGKDAVTVENVVAAVDHVCQVVGDAAHVGVGSDFDGGFGAESSPQGFDTVADLGKIGEGLAERGYSDADVAAVMGGNWLRVLEALPSG